MELQSEMELKMGNWETLVLVVYDLLGLGLSARSWFANNKVLN
jgi:hypothetical protein